VNFDFSSFGVCFFYLKILLVDGTDDLVYESMTQVHKALLIIDVDVVDNVDDRIPYHSCTGTDKRDQIIEYSFNMGHKKPKEGL